MKIRRFLMVAFAAMAALGLASCEDDNTTTTPDGNNGQTGNLTGYAALLPGTWRVDGLTVNGEQVAYTNDLDITLTFNADGTGLMTDNGVSENNGFNWSVEGRQINVTPRNGVTMSYTIDTMNAQWAMFSGVGWPGYETAQVTVKIVKIGGVQPTPGPTPTPTPQVSLAGTTWVSSNPDYDVTISFLTETHCSFHQVESDESFDYRGTYTFDGINGTCTLTIMGAYTVTLTFTIRGDNMTATFEGDTYGLTRSDDTPAPVVNELSGTMWQYSQSGAGEGGLSMTNILLVFTSNTECTYIYNHNDSSIDDPVELTYEGTYTYANGGGELNFGDNGTGYFSIRENQMNLQFNGNVTLTKYTAGK